MLQKHHDGITPGSIPDYEKRLEALYQELDPKERQEIHEIFKSVQRGESNSNIDQNQSLTSPIMRSCLWKLHIEGKKNERQP